MKRLMHFTMIILALFFLSACNFQHDQDEGHDHDQEEGHLHDGHHENAVKPTSSSGTFGAAITAENAASASELPALLEGKETADVKLIGKVKTVCQNTGCWMDIDIGNDEIVHVTFKDDGFLMPMDAAGKTAVIEGVATYEEISVKMLKHLAEDEGKSQEEIDAITEPKLEYTLVAKGVILEETNF
jgi:hypothetical protein